jgi:hypothetical protein
VNPELLAKESQVQKLSSVTGEEGWGTVQSQEGTAGLSKHEVPMNDSCNY